MGGRLIGRLTGTGRVDYGVPASAGGGGDPMETCWEIEVFQEFKKELTVGSYSCWANVGDVDADGMIESFAREEEARAVLSRLRDAGREARLVKITREVIDPE